MCQECIRRCQKNEKPDDRIKAHDPDIRDSILEPTFAPDIMMLAYDRLNEVPDDQNARNVVILLALLHYRIPPPILYQHVRDEREAILEAMKGVY